MELIDYDRSPGIRELRLDAGNTEYSRDPPDTLSGY
jgi:hypothetical protein